MPQNYVPIFIFLAVVGILISLTYIYGRIIRTKSPSSEKLIPDESGVDARGEVRGSSAGRFYLFAVLFAVFDMAMIFLFPWAVKFKALGVFGLIETLIFLGIPIIGFIWVWKKGGLEWV